VTPLIEIGVNNTSYNASVFNPALLGQLAWDLGGGLGFSYAFGAYFDVDQSVAWSSTSLNQRFGLSYTGNDWDLTANVIYGIELDGVTNRPQISPCPTPFGFNGCNPDFINVDLTATKKFGKWEFGPVAYGSSDLTHPIASYQQQTQFAVGGLFGYDFGPLNLQAYATTDVVEHNYGGRDTRGWFRIIVPLWTAPALQQQSLITKG
jgi:Putative MetA-pathway of phenol degradation